MCGIFWSVIYSLIIIEFGLATVAFVHKLIMIKVWINKILLLEEGRFAI